MKIDYLLNGEVQIQKGAPKLPVKGLVDKHRQKYDRLGVDRSIRGMVYRIKEDYYVHIKVPSTSVDDFFYDVVFSFEALASPLDQSDIHMFSNSPGWVFTYAYSLHFYGAKKAEERDRVKHSLTGSECCDGR